MGYPEFFVQPMREELTRLGVQELRTPEEVDQALTQRGTVMVVVNSICGCAAGKARPGIAMALDHPTKPDSVVSDRPLPPPKPGSVPELTRQRHHPEVRLLGRRVEVFDQDVGSTARFSFALVE